MREKIFKTKAMIPINGVLCRPEQLSQSAPAVLILNSGVMHKVGTCRLSVKLARELADRNLCSVRFDFPGVGDSLSRKERGRHLVSSPQEIAEVMKEVEISTGIKKFVLYGLCSGADASFVTAMLDSRVVGIVQIDPYLFRTKKWYVNHYLSRFLQVKTWFNYIKARLLSKREMSPEKFIELAGARDLLGKSEVEMGYQKITERGVSILVIVTGGNIYTYNYEKQFYDIFRRVDWRKKLSLVYCPEASHIVVEPKFQIKIIGQISDWLAENYLDE